MHRNIPITFILFLILVVVVSVLIENHFKNDYLGGRDIWNAFSKDNYAFITSEQELDLSTVKDPSICNISGSAIRLADTVLNPGLDKTLFNPKFLAAQFIYYRGNEYYYNKEIKAFDPDIKLPYGSDKINEFKYMDIFEWYRCSSDIYTEYGQSNTLPKLIDQDNINNIIDNYEQNRFLNRYPLACYNLQNNIFEEYTESKETLSLFNTLDGFSVFKANQFRNTDFENQLFTKERTDYIWYFQYYAKIFIYNIFIPNYKSITERENDIIKKSFKAPSINMDIRNQNLVCYPVLASYGLYVCLIYDPRFGIIVACKGSEGNNEWANNFDKDGVATKIVINNFHIVLNSIAYVQEKYNKDNNDKIKNIAFTGHSLGGAIAQQLASLFVYNQDKSKYTKQFTNLHLVTFNSAGVSPFIRNMSLKFLEHNRSKIKDSPINIRNVTIRRRHDTVHQTGHVVFQSLDVYNKKQIDDFYKPDKQKSQKLSLERGATVHETKDDDFQLTGDINASLTNRILVCPIETFDSTQTRIDKNYIENLYDWKTDNNLVHILFVFDELTEQKNFSYFSLLKDITKIKPQDYLSSATILFTNPVNAAYTVASSIASNVTTQQTKNSIETHTHHYLIDKNNLFMYYNSKGLKNNNYDIELFRMAMELNKYKIEYIPSFIRSTNIASTVMQSQEYYSV